MPPPSDLFSLGTFRSIRAALIIETDDVPPGDKLPSENIRTTRAVFRGMVNLTFTLATIELDIKYLWIISLRNIHKYYSLHEENCLSLFFIFMHESTRHDVVI